MDKDTIAILRQIPVGIVREHFNLTLCIDVAKRIKNAVDVLVYQQGIDYQEALKALAAAFPEVESGAGLSRPVQRKSMTERMAEVGFDRSTLQRTAGEVLRQLDAFGVNLCHVYAVGPEGGYSSRRKYPEGMNEKELLASLPNLGRMNVQGANIFFSPVHHQKRISIPVDDVQEELLTKHRPSLVMETSDRSRQAHYILPMKYELGFYDYFTAKINSEWGDSNITSANHDTRLAGFTNRKRPRLDDPTKYPFVRIMESSPLRCETFESYADSLYEAWREDTVEQTRVKEQERLRVQAGELREVEIPEEVMKEAIRYRDRIKARYVPLDRSRADFMIASKMHHLGIDRNVIFSWLLRHAVQDQEKVMRKHTDGTEYLVKKNSTFEAKRRYAARTTLNASLSESAKLNGLERGHSFAPRRTPGQLPPPGCGQGSEDRVLTVLRKADVLPKF